MYDFLASLWRTVVPYIVGFGVVQLARLGVHVDSASAVGALTALFGSVYYSVFRLAEQHLGTGWGWFLGLARPPQYQAPTKPQPTPVTSVTPPTGA